MCFFRYSLTVTKGLIKLLISFNWAPRNMAQGDSMLRTLRSDTKINILNPNLDVKMFIKGVQTYLESLFSVPFVPNKKMLWLALKTLKV